MKSSFNYMKAFLFVDFIIVENGFSLNGNPAQSFGCVLGNLTNKFVLSRLNGL